jgi:hypothetical protein
MRGYMVRYRKKIKEKSNAASIDPTATAGSDD